MTSRIEAVFINHKPGQPAYIPFIMVGDPDRERSMEVIRALAHSGADLIELGVPFSDPVADGPVIQRAAERALVHNTTLNTVLDMVADLRSEGISTAFLIFSYLNPVYQMGMEVFAKKAVQAGVDGVLIVDLPPEEAADHCQIMQSYALKTVFLASPTTSDERLLLIDRCSTGFVYYVSRAGVTGAQSTLPLDLLSRVSHVRKIIKNPICVGFGISTPEQAQALRPHVDGIVIGSAVVSLVEGFGRHQNTTEDIKSFFKGLKI